MPSRPPSWPALALWLVAAGAVAQEPVAAPALRCGWFDNPTPGNAWLTDRDGEWTIGIQGGHQADGDWPAFTAAQWVRTNIHYGHGCACIKLVANTETREVQHILSARAVPLRQCRQDPALKEPGSP